ncbi:hypothetical protein AAV94_08120 [Lampropedia cohaerens]|uniref:DUF5666 domain-containing protein n=1 Tax=Lampropedia cohaerens TaxID=1610491 RepID=A0A0U1PZG2_9BURK|nr:DUF5666 domain-containing protein [Lampropedia cohaerens]KKW67876.1 hypothetical protein AAV94_08120 [Lampropedia cohaerens]
MRIVHTLVVAALAALVAVAGSTWAESLKGRVEAVDAGSGTIRLNGITFQTTAQTRFSGYSDLRAIQPGERVTIEFSRDGARYVATAVAQED